MSALAVSFHGQPLWLWIAFISLVGVLLALDLGVLNRRSREIGVRKSVILSVFYAGLGIAFGAFVWHQLGARAGIEYLTGFTVEKSLALDNVFVIATIFAFFAIPPALQHRVLFWGVLGVIVLRAVMIGAGAVLVEQFAWILYVFAAFLIATGVKLLWWGDRPADLSANPVLRFLQGRLRVTDKLHGERFFVRLPAAGGGHAALHATPLFLALVLIEVADVIFAVDSIPAIFAITTDPFIVYTSNIFAILGLRALYFALAAAVHRFVYLKKTLAVLLVFIGSKIFLADLLGLTKFPAEWSLAGTVAILASGILYSLWRSRAGASILERKGDL